MEQLALVHPAVRLNCEGEIVLHLHTPTMRVTAFLALEEAEMLLRSLQETVERGRRWRAIRWPSAG